MKIAFYSNYLTHHQLPLCRALHRLTGGEFIFVSTEPVSQEHLELGYRDLDVENDFVLRAYEGEAEKQRALQLAEEADVVIHGSAPREYLTRRLEQNKLTILYSERLYKAGYQWWKLPVRLWRFYKKYGRHKNLHLLCASAYTAGDFAKTGTFLNKTYKWGYFPEVKRYDDVEAVLDSKKPATILWVGRFLDWKNPETVVEVVRRLQAEGYDVRAKLVGDGERWDAVAEQVRAYGLEDRVQLPGSVPSDEVRGHMEQASIYLFTSDRHEGWGAVLNESMNSACAVVVSDAVGAAPFLLKDGENGLSYHSGNVDELYEKVRLLLDNPDRGRELGRAAYETMAGLWNAEVAAERLLELAKALLRGEKNPNLYGTGPCSRAERIKG